MNRISATALLFIAGSLALVGAADARRRTREAHDDSAIPTLDVRGSCSDAQKFSSGVDKNMAFKGCMQDETNAKAELAKRWSEFKGKDRSNCVEQARFPSPSYVEVLTCLEMVSDAMRAPAATNRTLPPVGNAAAPNVSPATAPGPQ